MSFRRFIYYSTLVGAWAAFVAWALGRAVLGRTLSPANQVAEGTIYGLFLGLMVALGLSVVDALWNFHASRFASMLPRVATAMVVGLIGSSACGGLGGFAFSRTQWTVVFLFDWIALGLLVGLSIGVFDVIVGLVRKDVIGPATKLLKCAAGGTLGGVLGGILAWLLRFQVGWLLGDPSGNDLWCPTAVGFTALGGLIGLLVGLSQVVLLEAWVKVEAGFRPGRDLIISRERTVIGRAEECDIALFGDAGVERRHAVIVLSQGAFYLEPMPDAPDTYVNEFPVTARTSLKTGDQIRVGGSLLRFNQRRKR